MCYIIRPATFNDTEVIRGLMENVLIESLANSPLDPEEMMASANRCVNLWLKEPESCYHAVAVIADKVAGVVMVKEHWNLVSLFVKPQYQHMGIGRSLVASAVETCQDKCPHKAIYLNAAQDSVAFYEKLGFVRNQADLEEMPGIVPMKRRYPEKTINQ